MGNARREDIPDTGRNGTYFIISKAREASDCFSFFLFALISMLLKIQYFDKIIYNYIQYFEEFIYAFI